MTCTQYDLEFIAQDLQGPYVSELVYDKDIFNLKYKCIKSVLMMINYYEEKPTYTHKFVYSYRKTIFKAVIQIFYL